MNGLIVVADGALNNRKFGIQTFDRRISRTSKQEFQRIDSHRIHAATKPGVYIRHTMRRKIPSLQALACFDAAARHESFTRAAQELALTQSAVSRQRNCHYTSDLFKRHTCFGGNRNSRCRFVGRICE